MVSELTLLFSGVFISRNANEERTEAAASL